MNPEIEEKTDRLIRLMHEQNLAGILINTQPNFAWLTAGGTNGVDSSRENGVATLFVTRDGGRYVLANRIEIGRVTEEELQGQAYEPVEFSWESEKSNPAIAAQRACSLVSGNLPLGADYNAGGSARVIENDIARLRYQLTKQERERFRRLGHDAGDAIGRVARSIKPGLSEREVARRMNDAIEAIGAKALVTLVASDNRLKAFRHPVPKEQAWLKEIMLVVCARRRGLIVSLTRIVCAGRKSEELSRRTMASTRVLAKLFAFTNAGRSGKALYDLAAGAYHEEGYEGEEKLHHQGGATGYRTRDWVAHPESTDVVLMDQAFAWNPSVSGSKCEETGIVTADGIEIVTTTAGWPSITIDGYLLPDVLEI